METETHGDNCRIWERGFWRPRKGTQDPVLEYVGILGGHVDHGSMHMWKLLLTMGKVYLV